MTRGRRFEPYIRRHRRSDRAGSFRVAAQLVFLDGKGFVLVQRGFPKCVMACALTKQELVSSIAGARTAALRRKANWKRPKLRDLRSWARDFGKYARGTP